MKVLGFVLVMLGILAMAYSGITYNRERTFLEVGSLKATATEQKHVTLSPLIGGLIAASGVALLMVQRKRLAPSRNPVA